MSPQQWGRGAVSGFREDGGAPLLSRRAGGRRDGVRFQGRMGKYGVTR